ncbi:MAG TPA: hypothetical protein VGS04_02515 [Nitrososphaerales archaeon]|nr:hypothetical protein [Nitrososphaerales archaeon]
MGTYAESAFHEQTSGKTTPSKNTRLAVVAVFSALIAVCTSIIRIGPLPAPLYEITFAPAIYLALAALVDKWDAFAATAIGGFVGELFNFATTGGSPIYPFGMIWARGPEAFIVAWAATRGRRTLAWAMVAATIYETLAFFFPDWLFYAYGLFQYGPPTTAYAALVLASSDFGTLIDLAFIPVAFAIIAAAGPTFRRLGYRN